MLHCPTCGRRYSAELEVCPEDGALLQADSTLAGNSPGDPLVGQTLDDKYRLDEQLGIGGMGTVYRARHVLIDRPVAVKVLNPRFVEDEAARVRFRREAKAAGRLQHTNAVTVTDFGQTPDGYVYLVMELLEGRTLREVLAKEAPLDTARAVALMLQVSAAVAAAHEAGIIHRDLKPANIFVVQRAEVPALVKVLDFGIAKLAADSLDEDDIKSLTLVGAMIGTPRYMSPEQCDGAELTPAADVYSLGVILYEMLTGTVPFSGSSPLAIALKHANEPPRSPREFVGSIPAQLEEVVLHALKKNPEERPADAEAFRQELLATADRLGLEHGAITSAPNIEALRSVGTESPSGRLVIDISRLRESRATDLNDVTVVSPVSLPKRREGSRVADAEPRVRREFPRVSVSFRKWRTQQYVVATIIAVLLIAGVLVALKFNSGTAEQPAVAATPTPTPEPTPTPTPTPQPKREVQKPSPTPKKQSKGGSVLKKIKRIFTRPF